MSEKGSRTGTPKGGSRKGSKASTPRGSKAGTPKGSKSNTPLPAEGTPVADESAAIEDLAGGTCKCMQLPLEILDILRFNSSIALKNSFQKMSVKVAK